MDENSQIKYVQLKDVDSDGFHKEAILYVEADSIKSYFHIPNPINAKNIDIVGINKDDKGYWIGGEVIGFIIVPIILRNIETNIICMMQK